MLGISVFATPRKNTVISSALCVLDATVTVTERSVEAFEDAARRINLFLGAWTFLEWGNTACGWWSWTFHRSMGGVTSAFDSQDPDMLIQRLLSVDGKVRRKIEAALYWVREPRHPLREGYRTDSMRLYAGYWNAFECLVDAVAIVRPPRRLKRLDKDLAIEAFIKTRKGRLTSHDVQECYQTIVNLGFVGRATHALRVCFGDVEAARHIYECFHRPDKAQRLYDIRNAINHGEIDTADPYEDIRVRVRLHELWLIVWRMLARILGAPGPAADTGG